jgi:predicted Zn-dependent protease
MLWILFITTALSRTLKMPATVYIEDPPPQTNLSRAEVIRALEKSAAEWEVLNSTVDFKIVDNLMTADVRIIWTATSHLPLRIWGYTAVWPIGEEGKAIDISIIKLRSDCDWKDADALDLQSTLTHELGHALGFQHSDVYEDTMYFSLRPGDLSKRSLTSRDRSRVRHAYPRGLFGCGRITRTTLICEDLSCAEMLFDDVQCCDDVIFEILYTPIE